VADTSNCPIHGNKEEKKKKKKKRITASINVSNKNVRTLTPWRGVWD
jgi:hypothetical protein